MRNILKIIRRMLCRIGVHDWEYLGWCQVGLVPIRRRDEAIVRHCKSCGLREPVNRKEGKTLSARN